MKAKIAIISCAFFFGLCVWLVVDAVKHHPQQAKVLLSRVVMLTGMVEQASESASSDDVSLAQNKNEPTVYPQVSAVSGREQTAVLGALYEDIRRTENPDKYKFQITLTTRGAAVKNAVLSEFKARKKAESAELLTDQADCIKPADNPLILLSEMAHERRVYSLANTELKLAPAEAENFGTKAFPLDKLNWRLAKEPSADQACFEAVLNDAQTGEPLLRITKTYRVQPGSYDLDCRISIENLSSKPLKALMQMQGPAGIGKEEERQDMRRVIAAYHGSRTSIETRALDLPTIQKKVRKNDTGDFTLSGSSSSAFVWAALTNKYFAAIVHPVPPEGQEESWLRFDRVQYYPASGADKDAHNCSFGLTSESVLLAAAGQDGACRWYSMQVYLGPKDRKIFGKNPTYRALDYFQTIHFGSCCCPAWMIAPLAFGIIWLMNVLYTLMGPLGNYGVIIMFLVFIVRLALHPITKSSQVSMMKMQKLAPKMQEIQKKYANNKAEMNRQVMTLYREMGISPVSGMLPMFLQMPIWIALWSAVNTSVDLRGAGFLPFWITDLSLPDHLFAIPFADRLQQIPLLGAVVPDYFNLLPILMGVVMYLQQKMMPAPQSAQTNPQMAQQQKMMMIMMPLLFPIMLYSGPSGVNLYIMASIGAGVVEQKVIRKHLQEQQEAEERGKVPVTAKTGGKLKKRKPKPFFKW
ncbi:MAG TPA: YidC/Oxa1 family insertase periplasmic-domain containing protein [Anaerohalosphaeraceae bacterium]|nr:YidC/Oxa1 family insertase periplasmic-domain containing protein [Anaerohalosphaeraceae bacterium]HOL31446.1 YidC/Oxa1 family insertase periplasmic-domain containing protein [Anaerohalosphaeraceae bacterium]HOM75316.1 YidC/Oxa1 family insertase periplasmic-domain containing protein [Anaerohalosphaeraceae bacterium]HPC63304.1 YidC/Oxa1 family insertase periplasmic-domain containing protein [Anaerohalosphaeraceae bacterium]HPO68990.1 YidC/Oxa1 family insertase periplasmic-domain containing pro